jgi:hypothetical protein
VEPFGVDVVQPVGSITITTEGFTMRVRSPISLFLLTLAAAGASVDATADCRKRFAIGDALDVVSATVDDASAADGPVRTSMRCRLDQPGTYTFHFEACTAGGRPQSLTASWPPAPPSPHASILPGGIHGGPPRPTNGDRGPTVTRDAGDPQLVTVRWVHGDSAARGGAYGVKLDRCEFAAATTRPATAPSR